MDLMQKARRFATEAHQSCNQTRKFTGEPYIIHPAAVVALLQQADPTPEMIAAAWLHDTVEDTPVTLAEIRREFGPTVEGYVEMLTDVQTRSYGGERIHRKNANLRHSALACPQAQTIKLCDLIDNSKNIADYDISFARQYLVEMARLLCVLEEGDAGLLAMASRQCDAAVALINRLGDDEGWFSDLWRQYEDHFSLGLLKRVGR
ncbi:HD domain-containing protein [Serratia liquefaciens]|uniref:HD domain-containing protein n=1 Tax=Serratia liquefaciens TaxID=614 RepID=UPI0005C9AA1E|nr:HD domain-containing protein [Serratia liquefaciens]GAK25537.1 metal dependent phosphohydrolase [Serratia liquefaciens FK01]